LVTFSFKEHFDIDELQSLDL